MLDHFAIGKIARQKPDFVITCGIVLLLVVAIVGAEELNDRKNVAQTLSWPVCDGRITKHTSHFAKPWILSYEFSVGGKKYVSQRIHFDDATNSTICLEDDDKYKVGEPVQVHYDPNNPNFAVLSTIPARGAPAIDAYERAALFGLAMVLGGWWRLYRYGNRAFGGDKIRDGNPV